MKGDHTSFSLLLLNTIYFSENLERKQTNYETRIDSSGMRTARIRKGGGGELVLGEGDVLWRMERLECKIGKFMRLNLDEYTYSQEKLFRNIRLQKCQICPSKSGWKWPLSLGHPAGDFFSAISGPWLCHRNIFGLCIQLFNMIIFNTGN